jgi:hypothetical protein
MIIGEVVERFEKESPVCVMVRATLENVFSSERLDRIFEENAERQRTNDLMFSSVADIMASVVCKIHPSVNACYKARADELGVTVKAVYDKLKGVEAAVSRGMVRETASHMAAIIEAVRGTQPELLPGYHVKIVDGNHLRRTDRRIAELRKINKAPLPGHAAVVLDPRLMLAIDVFPCEDGHAQERTLLPGILETVEARDVWIEDRNFCTTGFLFGIAARKAYYIIRQHAGNLRWELKGRRKRIGETETGIVYEQGMRIFDEVGNVRVIRRITIELFEPTRDGDTVIHILTNLPKRVGALRIANLYRKRWTIETAFQELAENLNGEINTLGYPKAALFGFCMALVSYNVLGVVKAAFRAAHGHDKGQEISTYYMADEIAATYRGMMIAIPEPYWKQRFANLTPAQMAKVLIRLAKRMQPSKYRKNKWTPKKKPTRKMNKRQRQHVSTARILEQRKKRMKVA